MEQRKDNCPVDRSTPEHIDDDTVWITPKSNDEKSTTTGSSSMGDLLDASEPRRVVHHPLVTRLISASQSFPSMLNFLVRDSPSPPPVVNFGLGRTRSPEFSRHPCSSVKFIVGEESVFYRASDFCDDSDHEPVEEDEVNSQDLE